MHLKPPCIFIVSLLGLYCVLAEENTYSSRLLWPIIFLSCCSDNVAPLFESLLWLPLTIASSFMSSHSVLWLFLTLPTHLPFSCTAKAPLGLPSHSFISFKTHLCTFSKVVPCARSSLPYLHRPIFFLVFKHIPSANNPFTKPYSTALPKVTIDIKQPNTDSVFSWGAI